MSISQQDYQRFFKEEGDVGFSPDRNRRIIEDTIKKHDAMRAKRMKEFDEALQERTDAAMWYLKHVDQHGTPIEKYFGRKELSRLQGNRILEQIQGRVKKLSYLT